MGRFLYFSIVFCIYSTLSAFAAETKDGLPFVLGHLGKKIKLRIELLKPLSLPEPTGGEFRHQPTYRVYFQNGSAIPEDLDRPFVSKIRPFPGAPDLNFNEPYCALTVRGRSEHGRKGRVLPKGAKMIFVENDYFKAEALVENTAEKLRITEGHYTEEKLYTKQKDYLPNKYTGQSVMITDIICGGQNLMMTDFEKVLGSENAKISVIEVKTMSSDSGNTEAKVDQESRFKKLPEKKELDQISNSTSTAEDRSIK